MSKLLFKLMAPETGSSAPDQILDVARIVWVTADSEAEGCDHARIRGLLADGAFELINGNIDTLESGRRPDAVLVDMAAQPGASELQTMLPDVPIIVLADDAALDAALAIGVYDVITPSTLARLPLALRHAAEAGRSAARIEHLARTDSLSGLANRNAFVEAVEHEVAEGRRRRDSFAVLYLDLDNFKDINDTLGHQAGDTLLIAVSERLRWAVRETDLVARLGGDEFAVLQTGLREPADAGTVADKLLSALAAPFHLDGVQRYVTASIGIAINTAGALSHDETIVQADTALYRAKDEGRNRYCFFAPGLDIEVRERVSLAEELRGALMRHEFSICYQPIISFPMGRIEGVEALLRWTHPRRGVLAPGAFLNAATKAGLTPAIDLWVLGEVCRQIDAWRAAGVPVVKTAVNIGQAPISRSREFIDGISDILRQTSVSTSLLDFELAEAQASEPAGGGFVEVDRLHRLGVRLVVDRFGAGPMSLERMCTGGFGRIKIAPRLVAGSVLGGREVALVRAAVMLARELGISVVGTGVETEDQLSVLVEAGCTLVQGFYLCPPVSAERMGEMLTDGRVDVRLPAAVAALAIPAVPSVPSTSLLSAPTAFRVKRLLQEDISRLAENLPAPVFLVERKTGNLVFGNEALINLTGSTAGALRNVDDVWERLVPLVTARRRLRAAVDDILQGDLLRHPVVELPEAVITGADGMVRQIGLKVLRSDRFGVVCLLDHGSNSSHEERQVLLESVDGVARFLARRAFFDRAGLAIAASLAQNEKLSIISFRLDHYDRIVAEFGRTAGERLLMSLPDNVQSLLRLRDPVGRIGGEEFIIVAPSTDVQGAQVMAERVRLEISKIVVPIAEGRDVKLTASFGVSELQPGEASCDNLMVRADTALFAARHAGGNQVAAKFSTQ